MDAFLSSKYKKPNQPNKLFGGLNNLPGSVMDPVSILSTIGAVGSVANGACALAFQLYTFVEETKNVNQAVTDLVEEVNSLNSILEAVKLGLESDLVKLAEKRANSDDSRLLWESIQGSLNDCQATIDKLEKAIVDVLPEGKNFAKQAVRRIKLNLKDSEIAAFRTQIKTHTNALQMALQMVNLRAAYLAPGAVTDELGPKIDKLRALMELVHGSENDLKSKSLGVEPGYLTGLQQSAQRVISGATTVSAESEAAGSVWGEVMDEEKREKTLSWIPKPTIHEEHDGRSTTLPLSDGYAVSPTTALTDYSASNAGEAESDSDGDFESEVVEASFARGIKRFNDGDFADAQSILQRGLQLAEKLPLERRQPARIAEVKLIIATCVYHSPNLDEAEARLLAITQEKIHEDVTNEGAIRRCQASHLLAGVLFRQGRNSLAKSFCRKALIGRRRVLGKNHTSYYESLCLLSQICEADGQQEDAETYWAMIPDEVASKLVKMKDKFPDMLERPSKSPGADEISPTLHPGDNTGRFPSFPETQLATIADGTSEILTKRISSQSLSPAASPRLSSQASPPSSRSISPKLPASLPHRPTLTSAFKRRSTSSSTTPASTVTTAEKSPVPRKPSFFGKLKRNQPSVPSTASTAPTEVSITKEMEGDTGVSGENRPPPPRGNASGFTDVKPKNQSFLNYLHELDKLENQRDEGIHWPGLN